MHPLTIEMRNYLVKQQNPVKAAEMAAYMKNQFPFLGIATPQRTASISATLKKSRALPLNEIASIFEELFQLPEREFHYAAIDLLKYNIRRFSADFTTISDYISFIEFKAWWDSVDSLRKAFSLWTLQNQQFLGSMMGLLLGSENFWLRRTAITLQLQWKQQTNIEWLEKSVLDNQMDNEFFIQKAIGWALREYSKTDRIWVRDFLSRPNIRLSGLAIREASKYL